MNTVRLGLTQSGSDQCHFKFERKLWIGRVFFYATMCDRLDYLNGLIAMQGAPFSMSIRREMVSYNPPNATDYLPG